MGSPLKFTYLPKIFPEKYKQGKGNGLNLAWKE